MTYLITFLEGIITFVSPCLLPMIPIYVTYFAAGEEVRTSVVLRNALGFVLGFTCVFIAMGALASSVGAFFIEYQSAVNVVCGLVVIAFGLYFLSIIKINLFHGAKNPLAGRQLGFFSSVLFGVIFSVGWHAVRGGVPRLGAHAGLAAGIGGAGRYPASVLLGRPRYSVRGGCRAHRQAEGRFCRHQATLRYH